MLWEEFDLYTKLTGEDATHVPIIKIGAYLDGYEKGLEVIDKIRAEISDFEEEVFNRPNTDYSDYAAVRHCLEIIDKYKAESEDKK